MQLRITNFQHVSTVGLKGSCARGDYYPGLSDIDLYIIVNNQIDSDEFIQLCKKIAGIKKSAFFQFFDLIGEFELIFDHEVNMSSFKKYTQFFSWKNLSSSDFTINASPLTNFEMKVSFAMNKFFLLSKNSEHIHLLAKKRRLQNIANILNFEFKYKNEKSYDENKKELLLEINKLIPFQISHNNDGEILSPFDLRSVNTSEIISYKNVYNFIHLNWSRNSEHFKTISDIYTKHQWKSYFVNTGDLSLDSKQIKEVILNLFLKRAKICNKKDKLKTLTSVNFITAKPEIYYQEGKELFNG